MASNEARIEISAVDKTAQAFDSVKNKMNSLTGAGNLLSSSIVGLTSALSVGVFSSMIRDAANAADAINDVAKANEVAVGSVLKLSQSLSLNGGNADDASKLFSSLTNKLDEAASGSEKAQVQFKKVGVSLQDLKTLDGQQLFEKSLAGLAAIEDPITRNAAAMDLFGKAVKGVDIKGLSDDYAANLKNFDETERVFKEIGKAMDNVDKAQQSMKLSLATSVGPWYAQSLNFISELITGYDKLEQNIRKATNAGANPFKAAPKITDKPEFGAFDLPKEFKGGERREVVVEDKKPKAKKESGKSEAEKYAEDMAKLLKTFDDAVQPTQKLSEKLQAQADSYAVLDPAVKSYLQGIVAQTQATEDAAAAAEAMAESNQRINDMMDSNQGASDNAQAVYDANAESYNAILQETQDINASMIENDKARAIKQLEIENERRLARIDLIEGEADQIQAIRDAELERQQAAMTALQKETSKSADIGKELGLTFSSAFEDSIVKGKEFSDILQGIGQDIIRILARKTVTEPLADMFSGIGSGVGDWFKGIIPNANGNVYAGGSISAFSGSVVNKPTFFASGGNVMGEAGPEGIFPLKRGKDGKLGVSVDGARERGNTYNVSVSVDATGGSVAGDNNRANDLGRQIEGAVRAVLLKEKRQGGVLA